MGLDNMAGKNKTKRIPLSWKLAAISIFMVAAVSTGMVLVSYYFYTNKINEYYSKEVFNCARHGMGLMQARLINGLADVILSDEYQAIREKAVKENNPGLLEGYIKSLPPCETYGDEKNTLYDNYDNLLNQVEYTATNEGVTLTSLDVWEGDYIYTIVSPSDGILASGEKRKKAEVLKGFPPDDTVPPLVYTDTKYGWVCSASEPVAKYKEGFRYNAMYTARIDLEYIMMQRHWFLVNSLVFVLVISGVLLLLNIYLNRRFISDPVKKLASGSRNFCAEDKRYTMEDVMELPINSRDEIGDLYTDIKDMQGRIVHYIDRLEKVTAEREHLNGQLSMAVRLKLNLIPGMSKAFPGENRIDIYADMLPMETIGGDYYDFFRIDKDHIAVVIADIFNGGTAAALFMVAFKIILSQFSGYGLEPSQTISAVNDRLYRDNQDNLTLSCWYGVIDLETGKVTAVNAGHETPLLINGDDVKDVPEDDCVFIIGMMSGMPFPQYEFYLHENEKLFLYTDGAFKNRNPEGLKYNKGELEKSLKGADGCRMAVAKAQEAVNMFTKNTPRSEDTTYMCIEWKKVTGQELSSNETKAGGSDGLQGNS
jgi:sigma-B regulation protein RsbU (phosphoserine phosphatase)